MHTGRLVCRYLEEEVNADRDRVDSTRVNSSRLARLALCAVLGAVSIVGCSSSHGTSAPKVQFGEHDFGIDAPTTIKAGTYRFDITGAGPSMHEFNVAETTMAAKDLPLTADGTVDDESVRADFHHVAEREGIDIGQRGTLDVTLTPGHYVLYCNMEGHYMAGMSADLVVTS